MLPAWLCGVFCWLLATTVGAEGAQQFEEEPRNVSVRTGDTVLLPCRVRNAVGQVQWTKDEFGLGTSRSLPAWPRYRMVGSDSEGVYSLEIRDVRLEDDAVFQCQVGAAAGSRGIRSENAQLEVLLEPSAPRIVQGTSLETTAGVVIRLQCESRSGKPPPTIEWFDTDGSRLAQVNMTTSNVTSKTRLMSDGKRYVVQSTLLLEPEARQNGGNITCSAINDALTSAQNVTIELEVQYPPEVSVKMLDSTQVNEYDDVAFNCTATANPNKDLIYKWFIRDEVVVGDHGQKLKLDSIGRELNEATVRCDVSNDVGTGSHSLELDIRYGPRFREEPKDASAESGEEVTIECDVDANPAPEIVWYKRDCDQCKKVVGIGSSLDVTVTLDSVGRYECRAATTGFVEISRQLMVFARGRPEVTARSPQGGAVGTTAHVECVVSSVPPPTGTTWYLYGRPLNTEAGRYKTVEEPIVGGVRSLLVISPTHETDFGLYNCSFRNEYGADSASVLLQIQEGVPLLIILSGVVGGIILIISIILVVVLCQRQKRPPGRAPADGSEKTTTRPSDHSTTDSDLKMEIRSSSSLSGRTGSERWDDDSINNSYRYPDDQMTEVSFPPVRKGQVGGYVGFPNYERDYAPSPVTAGYADPRLSARYGNPYLRTDSLSSLQTPAGVGGGYSSSLTNLPPPAAYGSRRAQHNTGMGQPPTGRLATHV